VTIFIEVTLILNSFQNGWKLRQKLKYFLSRKAAKAAKNAKTKGIIVLIQDYKLSFARFAALRENDLPGSGFSGSG
jgi:hypothetical protein